MAFRTQIIAALWAAGGLFTLMLCWIIYTTDPFILPPLQIAGAIAVTTLFWWLAGSIIGRSIDKALQARIAALRAKLDEGNTLHIKLEKQRSLLEQFTARALPISGALVEHAGEVSSQTLEMTQARASVVSDKLLATTDELSEEIQRMGEDARAQASRAEQLHMDLETLATQQPDIAEQLRALAQLAKQFNLLALNASIEGTRVLDRSRGIGLLVQEIAELGNRAEHMAGTLSTHFGQISDGAVRGQIGAEPLVSGARLLADTTDTLALLTDEQWAEIERLQRGEAPARDGSPERLKLMDSAQMLAEKSSMLRQSIESLVKNLQAA